MPQKMNIGSTVVSMTVKHGAPINEDFKGADGWTVTLRSNGKQFTTSFYQGSAWRGQEPEVKTVLECLFNDASCVQEDFEGFCSNLGYDSDSRKAEKIYKACQRTEKALDRLFGDWSSVANEFYELQEA